MKVKMKVHTGWNGKKLSPNDIIDVSVSKAKRWETDGIASIIKIAKSDKRTNKKTEKSN